MTTPEYFHDRGNIAIAKQTQETNFHPLTYKMLVTHALFIDVNAKTTPFQDKDSHHPSHTVPIL
jgi:hypothetical protein